MAAVRLMRARLGKVGYEISQVIRKRIEEVFGRGKSVGGLRQTVSRGLQRVDQQFKLTMAANDIVRMVGMLFAGPQGAAR